MYKVQIDKTFYSVEVHSNGIAVDQELLSWDLVPIGNQSYHLIKQYRPYLIEVLHVNTSRKVIQLKINGREYSVRVFDRYDLLLEKLGMDQTNNTRHGEVKAPMPGRILDVLVKEGETVNNGDKLIILEAMKMENIIKATGDGTIKSIKVRQGATVEKNQVLVQF